jgi:hypothetical protein
VIASLSDVALGKRLRHSRAWLREEVGRLAGLQRQRWAARAVRVRLVDATTVNEPGSRGTNWRVHAVLDLQAGSLSGVEVTDAHGGESLVRHTPEPGEIVVADRVHASRADLGALLAAGSAVVLRISWQNLPLQTRAGAPFDLIAWLSRDTRRERAVQVSTPSGIFPLRLLAAPLPPEQAERARRRARAASRKQGHTVDQRTLVAAGYVLLVSSLEASWRRADVLSLYRARWQIELLFKRLKGLWHLDQLRARDPESAQTIILARLLGALLAARLASAAPVPVEAWLDNQRHPLSRWRWEAFWHDTLLRIVRGCCDLLTLLQQLPQLRRALTSSPRRRPVQAATARHLIHAHASRQRLRCA